MVKEEGKDMSHGPKINYLDCIGWKTCYEGCPTDVFGWNEEENLPIVLYPDECSYCIMCEVDCDEMAIDVELPIWIRLEHLEYKK